MALPPAKESHDPFQVLWVCCAHGLCLMRRFPASWISHCSVPAWQFVLNQTLQPVNLVGKTSGWAARFLQDILLFLKKKEKEKMVLVVVAVRRRRVSSEMGMVVRARNSDDVSRG